MSDLLLKGKASYAVLTIGNNWYAPGKYSVDGGSNWLDASSLGYAPNFSMIPSGGMASNLQLSPNLKDVLLFDEQSLNNPYYSIHHLSHDGGKTWHEKYYVNRLDQYAHWNKNTNYCYLGGWSLNGFRSTDNGESWTKLFDTSSGYTPICFDTSDDGQYAYAGMAGAWSVVKCSSDGGTTWVDKVVNTGGGETDHTVVKCDSTGQYILAYYGSRGRRTYLSTTYGSTWGSALTNSLEAVASMKKDGSLILYYDKVNFNFYFSINKGSSWFIVASPIQLSTVAITNDFLNNDIYISSTNQRNIYKVNKDLNGFNLVRTTDVSIGNFLPSQYGRGAAHTGYGGVNMYYAKNYQTYIKVFDGSALYPMVL